MEHKEEDFNFYLETGKNYLVAEKIEEGLKAINMALQLEPDNEYAIFELGKINSMKFNYDKAIENYKKATSINPEFILPRLELAKVFLSQGRRELAEKEFKFVISNSSDSDFKVEALYELGKIFKLYSGKERLGDLGVVLKKMEENLGIIEANVDYNIELGKLYRVLGFQDLSADVFKKMLSLPNIKNDRFLHNKILNELEISERREILESKVRSMVAMIIDKCNLKCRICDIWKSKWQVREVIMKEIVDLFPYMEDINWEGGEVFMMQGFGDILKEGSKYKNLRQIIFTNGLMINEKLLEKMSEGRADIVFSIDGVSKETYEYIRLGGSFDRLQKVLSVVREFRQNRGKGIKIYLNPVVMRTNYKELEEFVEFAKKYEFDALTFNPIRGRFGDENIFELRDKEALDYIKKSMPVIMQKANEYGLRLNNWLPIEDDYEENEQKKESDENHSIPEKKQESNTKIDDMICYAPWQRMVLDNDGEVRPHVFCLNKWVGSTQTMSLAEIWNCKGMRSYRRKIAQKNFKDICQPECINGQVKENTCDII